MKRIQMLANLLGIAVIFGGTITVLAVTKAEEKPENKIEKFENINESKEKVSGRLDYIFNDGSMDRSCYDNANISKYDMQLKGDDVKKFNEACEGKCSIAIVDKGTVTDSTDEFRNILSKNSTNEIHGLALFFRAYAALDVLQGKGIQISNEVRDEILDVFAKPCTFPSIIFNRILTIGSGSFKLSKKGYEVFLKMIELTDFELTKEKFEVAKKDLLNRMNKSIDEREKMNERIVVRQDLNEDDLKNIPENEKLKGKVLVSGEKTGEMLKDDNKRVVKLIRQEMEKIEQLDFDKVLDVAKVLEWKNCLGN